jgi:hypothetical protein
MNNEADDAVELNEEKSNEREKEVKVVCESSRSLSFWKKMKGLSPYYHLVKDRMMDKTVSYVDLLRPGPPPSRRDNETSRRLATRK